MESFYSSGVRSESIAKVDSIEYCSELYVDSLDVTCKNIFFNGKEFIWKEKVLKIMSFSGNKPIRDLDHYPFDMHLDIVESPGNNVQAIRKSMRPFSSKL